MPDLHNERLGNGATLSGDRPRAVQEFHTWKAKRLLRAIFIEDEEAFCGTCSKRRPNASAGPVRKRWEGSECTRSLRLGVYLLPSIPGNEGNLEHGAGRAKGCDARTRTVPLCRAPLLSS